MNGINGKVFVGVVGGFGLGNGSVYLLAGVHVSAVVASVIGVLLVYLAFVMKVEGCVSEATIEPIKAREDKRQQKIAEGLSK